MGEWPRRWRSVPDDGSGQAARRIAQGRALHGSGRVTGLRVAPGVVRASVQGTKATPYGVRLTFPVWDDETWARVFAVLASRVRYGARLVAGAAPEGLEDELAAEGLLLFVPAQDVSCGCQDERSFCAHAAGVWEAFAAVLEEDPLLIFTIRGRGRERVLVEAAEARGRPAAAEHAASVGVDELAAQDWFQARADLGDLFIPAAQPASVTAPLLRVLGTPSNWPPGPAPEDLLAGMIVQAAEWAVTQEQ